MVETASDATSSADHANAPRDDQRRKLGKGIFATPAGMQITALTPGSIRPMQTARAPRRLNQT